MGCTLLELWAKRSKVMINWPPQASKTENLFNCNSLTFCLYIMGNSNQICVTKIGSVRRGLKKGGYDGIHCTAENNMKHSSPDSLK